MNLETRRGWDWRPKLQWFAAEFLVVVTGVLVALALGAIFQQRQNGRSEEVYLSLLARDLTRTIADLEEVLAFEDAQFRDGLVAYRAISTRNQADFGAASSALQRLTVRRTLRLQVGTYQDLISTGNLRLIRNRELRDSIVGFFEGATRLFDVINKNNTFFVDELYVANFLGQGWIGSARTLDNMPALVPIEEELSDSLRAGYVGEPDRLWSMSTASPDWAKAKSILVARIRASAIARNFLRAQLKATRDLKAALDAE